MSNNPYEPPITPPGPGVPTTNRNDLRTIATYQKGVLVCILIYIIAIVAQIFVPAEARWFFGVGVLVLGLVGTVFVFLLATQAYGTGVGILLGILTLVPCIGLIVLLVVNGKATSILKQNGIRVGLLGANTADI